MLSTTSWFTTEIQQMMFGFGDCRRPLTESAVLVEEIVHQQMTSLLCQSADVAVMRGNKVIGLEDILFLLRNDKVKLRRLLRYLELKDLKVAALRGAGLDDDDHSGELGEPKPHAGRRRRRACMEFLSSIDQTGELVALFDDPGVDMVKHERLVRAELISRNMDPQQYIEFCEARQANFSRRYKSQRFKDWLMMGVNVEVKPNPQALEVISYLAYETVAQVVDLALVVKQDMRAVASDPLQRVMAPVRHNYHDLQSSSHFSAQAKQAQTFQSPPTTPIPGAGPSQGLNSAATNASNSSGASMLQPGAMTQQNPSAIKLSQLQKKKRKRSGPATTLDTSWSCAIMPADIREAMRRYYEDSGPFASSTKVRNHFIPRYRLLCT